MTALLTFDDVLISPKFSKLNSRSEVDLSGRVGNEYKTFSKYTLPVVSANMDTITSTAMAKAMLFNGGLTCLHRFCSIPETVDSYQQIKDFDTGNPWISIGLGDLEQDRAKALYTAGARVFVLDVAHGAQARVAEQYKWLKESLTETFVIVGNFATHQSLIDFWKYLNFELKSNLGIDGVKVGVGPGSACTTRLKTGCGIPQLSAIQKIANSYAGLIIADGGMRTPGDIAKALAAGADLVMLGGMLAGTDETPGEILQAVHTLDNCLIPQMKKYRGSASKESYQVQGKDQEYITTEGESFTVPVKGPVKNVLKDIEGGLRSAFTYVGAQNIQEFKEKAKFIRITNAGKVEGTPHGKI